MCIKWSCYFHETPISHPEDSKKFYDLLGQPSYMQLLATYSADLKQVCMCVFWTYGMRLFSLIILRSFPNFIIIEHIMIQAKTVAK